MSPPALPNLRSLGIATLLAGCVTPPEYRGPLPVRNQHPAQLVVHRMEPAPARTVGEGAARVELSASYSSLFLRGFTATETFVMDGELLRTVLGAKYGLSDTLQLEFAIPTVHTTGGFLDHSVEQWHDLLDTPESGRDNVPENLYQVNATRNGQSVYSLEKTSLALGDVPIGLTWQLLRPTAEEPFAFAVRGAVELPTGDAGDGTGNGGLDLSLGLVGEAHMGPIGLSAHVEYAFAHTPARAKAAGVEYRDVASGGLGIEAAWTADTAIVLQFEIDQSVLRDLNRVNTDGTHAMLWVGLRSRLWDGVFVELSFGEDIARHVSPDFSGYLGFRVDMGRRDGNLPPPR